VEVATYLKALLSTPFDGMSNRLYPSEKRLQQPQKGSGVGPKAGSGIEKMRKCRLLPKIKPRFYGRLIRGLSLYQLNQQKQRQQQQQQQQQQ